MTTALLYTPFTQYLPSLTPQILVSFAGCVPLLIGEALLWMGLQLGLQHRRSTMRLMGHFGFSLFVS